MIKYFILLAIFGLSTIAGIEFSNTYARKVQFYEDALDFSKILKNEIIFMKTDIMTIFSRQQYKSQFNDVLNSLKTLYFEKNGVQIDKIDDVLKSFDILNENDRKIISGLFSSLGKLSYEEQLKQIDFYTDKFQSVLQKQRMEYEKMSPFCKKMGILVGLAICIVLF